MNNKNIFSLNENSVFISILFINILGFLLKNKNASIALAVFWTGIIMFHGNVRRVYSEKHPILWQSIRRISYVLPCSAVLLIGDFVNDISYSIHYLWSLVSVIIGILFVCTGSKVWRIFLSKEFILSGDKKKIVVYLTEIFMFTAGAIAEELFFRGFIIGYVMPEYVVTAILMSSFLFFIHHFGLKWSSDFSKNDFIIQILFGVVSSVIFIYTKSIVYPVIIHIVYNFPHVIKSFKGIYYYYICGDKL